jgi:hypothetical protein
MVLCGKSFGFVKYKYVYRVAFIKNAINLDISLTTNGVK